MSEIKWKCIGVFLCAVAGVYGQTTVDLRTQAKNRQHADTHRYGGNDEVGTATPSPHAVPESDATGRLSAGWLPDLSGTYQPVLGFQPLNRSVNLSDLPDPGAARNNLGLGNAALKSFDGAGATLPSATGPFATYAVPARDATGTLVDSGCTASNATLACGSASPTRFGVRQGAAPTDATINGLSNDAVFYLDSADGYWKMRTADGTVSVLSGAPTIASFVNAQHNHSGVAQGGQLGESSFQFSDTTTGNATSAAHGLLPKLPNNSSLCLHGDGTYAACGAAPGGSSGQVQINLNGAFAGRNLSGNGSTVATTTGALSMGDCVKIDGAGNFVDSGSPCTAAAVSNSGALTAGNVVSGAGGAVVQDGGFAISDIQRLSQTQTVAGDKTYTGRLDASGATHTLPSKTGLTANKPATCTVGEEYFATDAAAGQNKYYCTATNSWTQQSGSGGTGVGTMFGAATSYFSLSTGVTYLGLSQPGSMSSTIGQIIPAACTAKRLYVRPAAAINSGGTITVSLFNASTGVDTALAVTLPAGGALQTYSDLTDTVALTAGQMYSLHFNNQSAAANSGYWSWGFQCQ